MKPCFGSWCQLHGLGSVKYKWGSVHACHVSNHILATAGTFESKANKQIFIYVKSCAPWCHVNPVEPRPTMMSHAGGSRISVMCQN